MTRQPAFFQTTATAENKNHISRKVIIYIEKRTAHLKRFFFLHNKPQYFFRMFRHLLTATDVCDNIF